MNSKVFHLGADDEFTKRQWPVMQKGVFCLYQHSFSRAMRGFTLAELLIALAILGVIATFTIPKVLQAQQNSAWNSAAKEAAAAISAAYQLYRLNNTPTSSFSYTALTPYLNYVKRDTTSQVDRAYGQAGADIDCSGNVCIALHSGGILWNDYVQFGGTSTTNAIYIPFDPDGKAAGTTNGPGKTVSIYLYYNGKVTTSDGLDASTCTSYGCWGANSNQMPDWFSW